ncbi:MAG TPA: ATPase, T2SS/T4P/T4SS family [Planctomycetota bacterium]|jgi:type IV pilus assembly protein PilB
MVDRARPFILCVDDSADWLALAQRWLSNDGLNVVVADSAAAAQTVLHSGKPDLILLDAMMPGMNGYEFCRQLQSDKERALIPVVFITGLDSTQDKALALACGAVNYLVKPVQQEKLLRTVRQHLLAREHWQLLGTSKPSRASDLRGFLDFVFNELRVPAPERVRFGNLTADRIYSLTTDLGLDAQVLAKHLAAYTGRPYVPRFDRQNVELGVLPTAFCRARHVIPLNDNGLRQFVVCNPLDWQLLDDLNSLGDPGQPPQVLVTHPDSIDALFRDSASQNPPPERSAPKEAPLPAPTPVNMAELEKELGRLYDVSPEVILSGDASEESAPIIMLVNKLIDDACEAGASDIHIEPWEDEVVVRFRIDGDLRIVKRLRPQRLCLPLVARIKIMSQLDIIEKRLPQDGRVAYKDDVDLRVATSPMMHGEKVVLRLLDKRRSALSLEMLGYAPRNLRLYREKIASPYGMILHVGPTGSGKSMSLFAALKEIAKPELNIQTIEDPIEYTLQGINQMQVHADIGLTFGRALRSYLRQDPDVILVGEIRDRETADAAIEAALTGHLLLSTLHTNDAASTIVRLIEMGVEPHLVSSSIVMICAQRLLRCLCRGCKTKYAASAEQKAMTGAQPDANLHLYRSRGCPACGGTGYKGRQGTHELFVMDDVVRGALATRGMTADTLKHLAVEHAGMTTLYWDAMERARQGTTSIEEVLANVRRDDFDSRPKWLREPRGAAVR